MQGGRSSRDKNSSREKAVALPTWSSCAASEHPLLKLCMGGNNQLRESDLVGRASRYLAGQANGILVS